MGVCGGTAPTPPGGQRPPLRKGAPGRRAPRMWGSRADKDIGPCEGHGSTGGSGTRPYGRACRELHSSHLRAATWGRSYIGTDARADDIHPCIWGSLRGA